MSMKETSTRSPNIEDSKKSEESDEESSTTSEESSQSSSEKSSSSSSSEDSEKESEEAQFASGESEGDVDEEENYKELTFSSQIKEIINGLEFSDEDSSTKNKSKKEVTKQKKVSFTGLLCKKEEKSSLHPSDKDQQQAYHSAQNNRNIQKKLKSSCDTSETKVINGFVCTNVVDSEETSDASETARIEITLRKRKPRVKKETAIKSQYFLRKSNKIEPSKPIPKASKPSPKKACNFSSKQAYESQHTVACKPSPRIACKLKPKQPCRSSPKGAADVNLNKEMKNISEIAPLTIPKLHDGDYDSEETESAEESRLYMVDSDSNSSARKKATGLLASRVEQDHNYQLVGSFIKNNKQFERKSRSSPSKKTSPNFIETSNGLQINLQLVFNDSTNSDQSKVDDGKRRSTRKAAIDAGQKISKTARKFRAKVKPVNPQPQLKSASENCLDLSSFVYPTVIKTEPIDTEPSSPETQSFRLEDSDKSWKPSDASYPTVSTSENNSNCLHPIPLKSIIKQELVETEDILKTVEKFRRVPRKYVTKNCATDLLDCIYEDLIPIPVPKTDSIEAGGTTLNTQASFFQTVPGLLNLIFVDTSSNPLSVTAQTTSNTDGEGTSVNGTSILPISIVNSESLKTGTAAPDTCPSLETNNSSLVSLSHQSQSSSSSSDICLHMECCEEDLSETQNETLSTSHIRYNSVSNLLKDLIPGFGGIMVPSNIAPST